MKYIKVGFPMIEEDILEFDDDATEDEIQKDIDAWGQQWLDNNICWVHCDEEGESLEDNDWMW